MPGMAKSEGFKMRRVGSSPGRLGASEADASYGFSPPSRLFLLGGNHIVPGRRSPVPADHRLVHVDGRALNSARERAISTIVVVILLSNVAVLVLPMVAAILGGFEWAGMPPLPAAAWQGLLVWFASALFVTAMPLITLALAHVGILRWPPAVAFSARLTTWLSVALLRIGAWLGRRPYWTFVTDDMILGAMPLPSDVPKLHQLGVRHVINLCEEYEGPLEAYDVYGIRQLHLPTIDYSPPTLEQLRAGVSYLGEALRRREPVYVHCKAGQGRSATLVVCYLIRQNGWSVAEAQKYLQARRPRVASDIFQRPILREFLKHDDRPIASAS